MTQLLAIIGALLAPPAPSMPIELAAAVIIIEAQPAPYTFKEITEWK